MLNRQAGMHTRLATLSDLAGWGGRVYERAALELLAEEISRRIATLNQAVQDTSRGTLNEELVADVDVLCGAVLEQHELREEVHAELELLNSSSVVHPRDRQRH